MASGLFAPWRLLALTVASNGRDDEAEVSVAGAHRDVTEVANAEAGGATGLRPRQRMAALLALASVAGFTLIGMGSTRGSIPVFLIGLVVVMGSPAVCMYSVRKSRRYASPTDHDSAMEPNNAH